MNSDLPEELYQYVKQKSSVVSDYLEQLGIYGVQPEGGLIRPVYSPPWLQAFHKLEQWMKEIGLETSTDAVGNLWGKLVGREKGQCIASGSHLDTVKGGGRYDGALGILAALSSVRFLKEIYGQPRLSIEVVALCEEEGSRFNNSFLGSRGIIGQLPKSEVETSRDENGITIEEAARRCGFNPDNLESVIRSDIRAFLELHIEQGRILDDAKVEAGIVEAITGLNHLNVVFKGRADHAGTTPMDLRADALVAAAAAINDINRVARELGRPAVATVGQLKVEPGATNIVPERVEFTVDLRHSDKTAKENMAERIRQVCREAAEQQGVQLEVELLMDHPPAPMTPEIIEVLKQSADELGISNRIMVSGAGHDSQVMVEKFPTGMVFVPSRAGRSHSSAEFTPIEEIVPGIAILSRALYRLAY